ncbi:MAG: hypothetical protein ACLSGB_09520 [Dorea sp.]
MDYRKFGECYYIRMDRDDEIISTILEICKKKISDQPLFPESEDARMQKSRPLSQRQAASKNSAF